MCDFNKKKMEDTKGKSVSISSYGAVMVMLLENIIAKILKELW